MGLWDNLGCASGDLLPLLTPAPQTDPSAAKNAGHILLGHMHGCRNISPAPTLFLPMQLNPVPSFQERGRHCEPGLQEDTDKGASHGGLQRVHQRKQERFGEWGMLGALLERELPVEPALSSSGRWSAGLKPEQSFLKGMRNFEEKHHPGAGQAAESWEGTWL